MDKSWIDINYRFSTQYMDGVRSFIQFATDHIGQDDKIRCPCRKCMNVYFKTLSDVERDLYLNGMQKSYKQWVFHGETVSISFDNSRERAQNDHYEMQNNEHDEGDEIPEMLEDLVRDDYMERNGGDAVDDQDNEHGRENDKFESLLKESQCPLYPGCTKFSALSFLVKLLHLKVMNKWSNKSLNMLLLLLKDAMPEGETLPSSHYEAKKMLRDLGLGYVSIDACRYDCALFWKEHEKREICPVCGESRWKINDGKGKKIAYKVLRYFPLKPRLQRLFMSRKTAMDMRWHKDKRVDDGDVMRHPADSKAWKDFDNSYPAFAQDPRNIRLGLATDGFNPFGNMSNSYSMWPVILMPYNLPPWKCMKEPFFMMSLLIPGPQAPGKDIDVYLRPLIDELKELWENGVQTYDAHSRQKFNMHAAVLWTINDFPAYANLSGWSTRGHMACPTCNDDTPSISIRSKICYMRHRRFLPVNHSWRKSKKFDGFSELDSSPVEMSGLDVLGQLSQLPNLQPGKHPNKRKRKRGQAERNWTKRSIFFELPYWEKLKIRHCLDVMHIEKNICDNVLGTILNIEGKNKDTLKARMDLADMNIRSELHLQKRGESYVKPPACYSLSKEERQGFCEFLKSVKYPDGYAANISRCVSVGDGKITGLKSHDCHVLLQRLLPSGMRGFLNKEICTALFELGDFFRQLCSKTLRLQVLEQLEKDIAIILCKLEMIFPPAFFDVMVHLAIHLPNEAKLAGPVQNHWMYPIERHLGTLKGYVMNKARPEGSIAEGYIVNEALTFCSMYLRGIETRFNRDERNDDSCHPEHDGQLSVFSQNVRPFGHALYATLSQEDLDLARWYILNNCEEVEPYLTEHEHELRIESEQNIDQRQKKSFPLWFQERMRKLHSEGSPEATDDLWSLGNGPDTRVKFYSGCIVNGVRFHTKDRDDRRRSQNSGLVVEGEHEGKTIDFYGVLKNVVVLNYIKDRQVVMFQCDWFDLSSKRTFQRDSHFTSINITKKWYQTDSFILANQAQQVFYINDTKLGRNWQVVQYVQHRHLWDVPELESIDVVTNPNDAYQEVESNEVIPIIEAEVGDLDRGDIEPEEVDGSFDLTNTRVSIEEEEDVFDSDDEEDDTLIEYCDEEEEMENIEIDSDID